ncbi:MAG: DUF2905 domain-containing protein [Candidatus Dormibacteraeota bacterium]|nr:DUF2905 domain-containing protein [Candidatus Dormibacteraeota bacterium]
MPEIGRLLIVLGGLILVVGIFLVAGWRIPFLGRLPGDLSFSRGNTHVFIPLASGVVISLILTVLLNVFFRSR